MRYDEPKTNGMSVISHLPVHLAMAHSSVKLNGRPRFNDLVFAELRMGPHGVL